MSPLSYLSHVAEIMCNKMMLRKQITITETIVNIRVANEIIM